MQDRYQTLESVIEYQKLNKGISYSVWETDENKVGRISLINNKTGEIISEHKFNEQKIKI